MVMTTAGTVPAEPGQPAAVVAAEPDGFTIEITAEVSATVTCMPPCVPECTRCYPPTEG